MATRSAHVAFAVLLTLTARGTGAWVLPLANDVGLRRPASSTDPRRRPGGPLVTLAPRPQHRRRHRRVTVGELRSEPSANDGGAASAAGDAPTLLPWVNFEDEFTRLVCAGLLGVATGLGVGLFKTVTAKLQDYAYNDLLFSFFTSDVVSGTGAADSAVQSGLVIALVPALGGIAVALLRPSLGLGSSLPQLVAEVDDRAPFSDRSQLGRAAAAVATLGTGNSLGPEGPSVEIGAGLSRVLSSRLAVSAEWQQQFLSAGAAAGIAAGFNAPIAALFFTVEILQPLQRKGMNVLSRTSVASILLCAVMAALTTREVLDQKLAFAPALYDLKSPLVELPLYLGLGVVSGLIAAAFKAALAWSNDAFSGKIPGLEAVGRIPRNVQPALAGIVCGAVGLAFPQILFFGYATLDSILANTDPLPLAYLLELCGLKLVLTALCSGSGLVGGTFAPSLFLGATAGAAYQQVVLGLVANAASALVALQLSLGVVPGSWGVLPNLQVADAPAYAMVGAASVLAGLFNAPLTSALLLFELTRDFDIILPLMASAGVSSLLNVVIPSYKSPTVEGTEPDDGALRSPSGATLTVEDALVRAPFALAGDTDVLSAAQQLVAAQHRVVLVTAEPDAGTSGGGGTLLLAGGAASVRVVGIVTVDDLLRTLESDKDRPAADALIRGEWAATGVARPPAICVGDVCTVMCLEDVCDAPPPAVRVDEALSEAMTAQLAGMYGALLVVAGHGGGGDEEDGARRSENDAGELLGVVTRESAALAKALASY